MNRNTVTLYLAFILFFSCLQTGVFGLTADPDFEQPLSSLEAKTVLNIPDNKVRAVSLFGTKENPVTQTKPLPKRTFAWFWDNWFKDDDFEEPLAVEPTRKNTASETPEKKIIKKKGNVAEELPWWKPDAYEIIEEDTPYEEVPENKIRVAPPVLFRGEPVLKAKPEMQMKKAVPEKPLVVKPEIVEIPKPIIVPEEVPEKKILAVPQVAPAKKSVLKAKPEKQMKKAVPEKPLVVKPEIVEVSEPTIVPEIVPEKKILAVPQVAPVEKLVVKAKPENQMKKAVPEKPLVVKPEIVEVPEPTIVPEIVPEKKILAVPQVAPVEKPVVKAKPEMQMKKAVPEKPLVVKPETVEIPKPTIVPEIVPEKKILAVPQVAPVEKPVVKAKPEIQQKEAVAETKVTSPGFFKGAKACEECHEGEYKIWKRTKHHTSFRTVHREPKDVSKPSPKKILANVAGAKRMKRNKTCYLCHYTLQQKAADAKPVAKSGTSCESCHGASSEYLAIHDNYGGEGVKREAETPGHRKERIAMSTAKGLIWPVMKYQVVENCMTCHGLAHPGLSGDLLAKMLGAGHPINPDFEAVKYSQGTVRHRYTPEDIINNREMTEAEKAELFVIGHAAALVSAKEAMSKSNEPKYVDAQNKRAKNAEAVLSQLTDIPEAAQLMAEPNRSNALKLVNALTGKDLTGKVGSMLPAQSDYK